MSVAVRVPSSGATRVEVHISTDLNTSAFAARQKANAYLASEVGNLLGAGDPELVLGDPTVWRLPVTLYRPGQGSLGAVGTVEVDAQTGELLIDDSSAHALERRASELAASSTPHAG